MLHKLYCKEQSINEANTYKYTQHTDTSDWYHQTNKKEKKNDVKADIYRFFRITFVCLC